METISYKYHKSIYMWSALCIVLFFGGKIEGLFFGIIAGSIVAAVTYLVRRNSEIAITSKGLLIKKFSSSTTIPFNKISTIEHQKSALGSYGMFRVITDSGNKILVKRVPNVISFVEAIQAKMENK